MACGTLYKVVQGAQHDRPPGTVVASNSNVAVICAVYELRVGKGFAEPHEGLIGVSPFKAGAERVFICAGGWLSENGRMDPPGHRSEVGDKRDPDWGVGCNGKLLFDFGEVAMFGKSVGPEALVAFSVKVRDFGLPAGTAHPACAGDCDRGWLDQAGPQQGHQWQEDAGGIAPRRSDKPRLRDFFAVELRQSENGFCQQGGRPVFLSIKLEVGLRTAQTEVSAQINNLPAARNQRCRKFRSQTVRQREKKVFRIEGKQPVNVRFGEAQAGHTGVTAQSGQDFFQGPSSPLPRCHRHQPCMRMSRYQPTEFLARVSIGSHNHHVLHAAKNEPVYPLFKAQILVSQRISVFFGRIPANVLSFVAGFFKTMNEPDNAPANPADESTSSECPPTPSAVMREVFDEAELRYSFDEQTGSVRVPLRLRNVEINLICWSDSDGLANLAIRFPVMAPPEARPGVGELLHRLNYVGRRKFWEMDYDDGEIRMVATMDTFGAPLQRDVFSAVAHAIVGIADRTFPYLNAVITRSMKPDFAADQAVAALATEDSTDEGSGEDEQS